MFKDQRFIPFIQLFQSKHETINLVYSVNLQEFFFEVKDITFIYFVFLIMYIKFILIV